MSCVACCLCECTACIACTCCQKGLNGLLSISARLGHVALVATIFSFAAILGTQYPNNVNGYNEFTQIDLTLYCSDGKDDTCIYRQLIYRASFALFLCLLFLAGGTYFSEYLNRSYWPFKFIVTASLFVGFWWGSNGFFNSWAEFTRIFSLIWLLFQGLLMIDFAHDCHDAIIMKSDEDEKEEEGSGRKWLIFYMFLSLGFLVCSGVGLAYLFMNYSGCSLGTFFIVVTMLFGVGCLIASLLNSINKGFLTPSIMFAYSVFMCWYALLSSPSTECNPTANEDDGYQWRVSVVTLLVISFVILMYCVINGTVILNIFNPEGQGVMQTYQLSSSNLTQSLKPGSGSSGLGTDANDTKIAERTSTDSGSNSGSGETSGTPHERSFFHVLLLFFVIYANMMLTNWGNTNGNSMADGSNAIADESMWFKIIGQWIVLAMYVRILQLAYVENNP